MSTIEKTASGEAGTQRGDVRYQTLLVTLLSLNFGILFFDRNALNFLMPFVKPDLGLSNTQVGLTASALSFAWAISALFVGAAADRSGKRKIFLIGSTLAFSVCSVLSGLAASFAMLIGARLLMGVAEGGVAPISQSMTAVAVSPERRGLAMGVMQNFGSNLLGSFVAPVLLVGFATTFGWHHAFFLAGIPGLVSALLLWRFVKEPPPAPAKTQHLAATTGMYTRVTEIFAYRNMVLSAICAVLFVSYLVVTWAFMPLYLTQIRGYDPETMSWLMGTLGISATIGSFVVPGLSDTLGRKPVILVVALLGVILPLSALYFHGSVWLMAGLFFVGWALTGTMPIFMGTIPSETVPHHHMTTAVALVMGAGEILGGVFSPTIAGWAADRAGLGAPLWILMGLCLTVAVLSLFLHETAPIKLAKKSAA